MKKKTIKNLTLNKKSISRLDTESISGKGILCITELCLSPVLSLLASCYNCSDNCTGIP